MIAVGADSFSDARRKALLLHCLGQGGQDVFANLTVVSTDGEKNIKSVYDVAVLTLMSHFAERSNVVAERHKFRMRVQQVDERVDAFVNSLQELALRCEFACPDCNSPSIKNVMVRDQVVEGVSDKKIQERLIIEGDLPLDKCLQLARQIEDAKRDALKLRNSGASDYYDGSVNAVKFRQSLRPRQQKSIEGKPLCFRCGSTDHLASSERCPAFGKRCNACQRMNHFSRCCRTRGQTSRAVNQVEYAEGDNSLDMEVLAISGITHKKGVYCKVFVNGHILEMCVDTAADRYCVNIDDLKLISELDLGYLDTKKYSEIGWPVEKEISVHARPFYKIKDELSVVNGILMRNDKVVVPKGLTTRIINFAHEAHQGMTRTKQRIRLLYWWPGIDTAVENLIQGCCICNSIDKTAKPSFHALQPVPYPSKAWSKLGLDIVGPIAHVPSKHRFIISVIDYYSKWPEISFAENVTSRVIIQFLMHIFAREGYPDEIITDNGSQLRSEEFNAFLKERAIRPGYASLNYPQANGEIERFNSVIKNGIQAAKRKGRPLKDELLQLLCMYRVTPHSTTGETPTRLLHSRSMRTKLNIVGVDKKEPKIDIGKVRERVHYKQNKYKMNADGRRYTTAKEFKIGDLVKIKQIGKSGKGPKYSDPIKILKTVGPGTYLTEDMKVWNTSKLVKVHSPDTYDMSELFDYNSNLVKPSHNDGNTNANNDVKSLVSGNTSASTKEKTSIPLPTDSFHQQLPGKSSFPSKIKNIKTVPQTLPSYLENNKSSYSSDTSTSTKERISIPLSSNNIHQQPPEKSSLSLTTKNTNIEPQTLPVIKNLENNVGIKGSCHEYSGNLTETIQKPAVINNETMLSIKQYPYKTYSESPSGKLSESIKDPSVNKISKGSPSYHKTAAKSAHNVKSSKHHYSVNESRDTNKVSEMQERPSMLPTVKSLQTNLDYSKKTSHVTEVDSPLVIDMETVSSRENKNNSTEIVQDASEVENPSSHESGNNSTKIVQEPSDVENPSAHGNENKSSEIVQDPSLKKVSEESQMKSSSYKELQAKSKQKIGSFKNLSSVDKISKNSIILKNKPEYEKDSTSRIEIISQLTPDAMQRLIFDTELAFMSSGWFMADKIYSQILSVQGDFKGLRCHLCDYPCQKPEMFFNHCLTIHNVHVCCFCSKKYSDIKSFIHHLRKHTAEKIYYRCTGCNATSASKSEANLHKCRNPSQNRLAIMESIEPSLVNNNMCGFLCLKCRSIKLFVSSMDGDCCKNAHRVVMSKLSRTTKEMILVEEKLRFLCDLSSESEYKYNLHERPLSYLNEVQHPPRPLCINTKDKFRPCVCTAFDTNTIFIDISVYKDDGISDLEVFNCPQCEDSVNRSKYQLTRHLYDHAGYSRVICKICEFKLLHTVKFGGNNFSARYYTQPLNLFLESYVSTLIKELVDYKKMELDFLNYFGKAINPIKFPEELFGHPQEIGLNYNNTLTKSGGESIISHPNISFLNDNYNMNLSTPNPSPILSDSPTSNRSESLMNVTSSDQIAKCPLVQEKLETVLSNPKNSVTLPIKTQTEISVGPLPVEKRTDIPVAPPSVKKQTDIPVAPPSVKKQTDIPVAPPSVKKQTDIPIARQSVIKQTYIPIAPLTVKKQTDNPVARLSVIRKTDIPVAQQQENTCQTDEKCLIIENSEISNPSNVENYDSLPLKIHTYTPNTEHRAITVKAASANRKKYFARKSTGGISKINVSIAKSMKKMKKAKSLEKILRTEYPNLKIRYRRYNVLIPILQLKETKAYFISEPKVVLKKLSLPPRVLSKFKAV
ncbi:hypothetical protein GQR58_014844 [Nymphon striatum]|nr:hypothetical protein GQR58_014844 [Nymphon striatum]